ncbi:hypothetical protein F5Y15DRAFT_421028 [Xylariaceae sp. FL0016]|nr:hypothetical protein F5Y15DRAFT_421028 [Xylariaceae sp. FL0016]
MGQMSAHNYTAWFIVPFDKSVVASIVGKGLVPLPNDTTMFPSGFPANQHPVLFYSAYLADIKQGPLEIPSLLNAGIRVPCVDQLVDGKTCFSYSVTGFIGGDNGQIISGLVPGAVGTLEGNTVYPGLFSPANAPYQDLGNGEFFTEVDNQILPNPLSGPGIAPEAFALRFTKVGQNQTSLVTDRGFKFLLNQPLISNLGLTCANILYYFNQTFEEPFYCQGTVDFISEPLNLNTVPSPLAGSYFNQACWSASAVSVGGGQMDCRQAAASLDLTSLL